MDYEEGWGRMPDGDMRQFANEEEYEDAFFDELYDMNNEFEIEFAEAY